MTAQDPSTRPKARRPRGLADRRGAHFAREQQIVEKVLRVYQAWGFERLETSAFEYADALGKFLPDQERPNEGVFALQDDDEQWLALRYDLTAPLARFVAENYDGLPKPYRRCAAGPVWRNEKPGPGRFREFWQCDADTVGAPSPAADAEMIAMACAALDALGLSGRYQLKYSDRRLWDYRLDALGVPVESRLRVLRSIDKFDRLGTEGVSLLLGQGRKDESGDFTQGAGLAPEAITAVLDLLAVAKLPAADRIETLRAQSEASKALQTLFADFSTIDAVITQLGITDQAVFDPSIVRGLEYYTGAVFEAELLLETKDEAGNSVRFGSVGGGGRYDDLVSRFKGQPIPATGFSIGVSRLAAALALNETPTNEGTGPVVVLAFDQADIGEYFAMAAELRAAGVNAEVYLGSSGPKAQFKYADKRAAPIAVIYGGDEKASGVVSLKDLLAGAKVGEGKDNRDAYQAARGDVQRTVPRQQLVASVKAILAEQAQ
ncbi:MAG: histidine--tRNA ligase [Caulobacterales bacterium]|jgi:histidyl-tRNA synthetase